MNYNKSLEKLENIFMWFHRNPELSNQEKKTTNYIKQLLTENNIEIIESPLKTGVVAVIRGKTEKPVIALRCDIDALPIQEESGLIYSSENNSIMHACGHDFHTTSILGTAFALKQMESQLEGTVKILFQPAEETCNGAEDIINLGLLKDVDAIFGLHVAPNVPVGIVGITSNQVTAAVDRFAILIEGVGCHAAHPNEGVDPILAASTLISSIQSIISRNINPFDQALISITSIHGGNTWNVIPGKVEMEGTVRTLNPETRNFIQGRMRKMCESIGEAFQCNIILDWFSGPPETNNDFYWSSFAKEVAENIGLKVCKPSPSLGGEDFAFYQQSIKGVFITIGTGESYPLHHPKFSVDTKALEHSSYFFTELAKEVLIKLSYSNK